MSQLPRPCFILDTSVALKWYFDDEPFVAEANAILSAFAGAHIDLLVPQHIHYEVANALRSAVNRRRFPDERARLTLVEFLGHDIPVVSGNGLVSRAWDVSKRYDCALYDGLYIALAEMTRFPLVHADKRLHNSFAGRFPHELWIEDYRHNDPDLT